MYEPRLMKKSKTTCGRPVTGIIIANAWDPDGNVTDVVVYADNEEIYLVGKEASNHNLLSAVQKRVRIIGDIIDLSNGRQGNHIKSFKVV